MKRFITIVFWVFFNFSAYGQQSLIKISYLPHWLPQAQFAGIYLAEDLGIFRQYGLDVNVHRGGPYEPPLPNLMKGEVDFTSVFLFQGIEAAGRGHPIVNIAQIGQRAALMLVAKKSTGIEKPADMEGMYLGVWQGFEILPQAFLKKLNVRMHIISAASPTNLFLQEGIAVTTAMWYNEYHTLLTSGLDANDLVTFDFTNYGLNLPEDGLYCLSSTYEKMPDVCQKFTEAVLQGWRTAFVQSDVAIESVRKRMVAAHLPYSLAHQRWMLQRMQDLILAKDKPVQMGVLTEADYHFVAQLLLDSGVIKQMPTFSTFYKGQAHVPE